jgi:poly(A) polymerase
MREIWLMQPRFERRTVNSARALIAQPRFRAGYDFLRLRADVDEVPAELADWWEDFHLGDDEEREALLQDLKAHTAPARRRVAAAEVAGGAPPPRPAPAAPATGDEEIGESAPRKKRRRRRRPAAAAGAAEPAAE